MAPEDNPADDVPADKDSYDEWAKSAVAQEVARLDADPKRTGVKATLIPWTEPPLHLVNDRWHGPPGAFIECDPPNSGTHWRLCCPACGELGSPRDGQTWQVTAGSWDDVTTLTLTPSIAKSCCGWHGYLRNGMFVT